MDFTKHSYTIEQLVGELYPVSGVPHFQRGQVWSAEPKGLLLESLFLDTPCGAIILWKPLRPEDHGVLLPEARQLDYLIVDGQQRLRSLHEVLRGFAIGDPDEAQGPEQQGLGRQTWCLNLARVPGVRSFVSDKLAPYPLFMQVVNPRLTKNPRASAMEGNHNSVKGLP